MISPNLSWLKGSVQLWETLDGGRSWKVKPLPRLAVPWDYADIQFADHRRGWLLMNALQELYETSDGAVTWEPKSLPLFDGQVWTAWLPPMTNFAWVGGGIYNPSASPTAPNYALKKYDSGGWGIMRPSIFVQKTVGRGTWKAHELPSCSYMVTQLRFWNEEAGFAVGDGCFYYTEDGGDGWKPGVFRTRSGTLTHYPDEGERPIVFFLDPAHGWLSLDNRSLYRTTDGGRTWDQLPTHNLYFSPEEYPDTLQFLSSTHGFGIATDVRLYETLDAGTTSRLVETSFRPRHLCIYDEKNAWVLSDDALYRIFSSDAA